jgi:hypothetical protein
MLLQGGKERCRDVEDKTKAREIASKMAYSQV